MCRGRLLCSRTLARKEYKSLMSEGFRELKWTCPLCSNAQRAEEVEYSKPYIKTQVTILVKKSRIEE